MFCKKFGCRVLGMLLSAAVMISPVVTSYAYEAEDESFSEIILEEDENEVFPEEAVELENYEDEDSSLGFYEEEPVETDEEVEFSAVKVTLDANGGVFSDGSEIKEAAPATDNNNFGYHLGYEQYIPGKWCQCHQC